MPGNISLIKWNTFSVSTGKLQFSSKRVLFLPRQVQTSYIALPISLRQPHLSLEQFRRALNTNIFDCVCRA